MVVLLGDLCLNQDSGSTSDFVFLTLSGFCDCDTLGIIYSASLGCGEMLLIFYSDEWIMTGTHLNRLKLNANKMDLFFVRGVLFGVPIASLPDIRGPSNMLHHLNYYSVLCLDCF